MTAETSSIVDLPHWETGNKKIRFLYLVGNNSFQVTEPYNNEEPVIPLFLGADLFSLTGIRSENHPRYHAKFAKRGMATKLVFPSDLRFQGLRVSCSSSSLWFYCVHGVFRVAFELYTKQEQLSVLNSFQDLWRSRIDDDQLNLSYTISRQIDGQLTNQEPETPRTLTLRDPAEPPPADPESEEMQPVSDPSDFAVLDVSRSTDHDYCCPAEQPEPCALAKRLSSIAEKIKEIERIDQKQEETGMKLLDYVDLWMDGHLDEERLAELLMLLLQTRDYSIYSSPLLRALGGWLGHEFHKANSSVSDQVEGFKLRHIEHIKDLPPAEDLATELFPEAMRNLLIHWMGLSDEAATWKRLSEYPIVLLILEFANHNLITGVAHVLYSSLISR